MWSQTVLSALEEGARALTVDSTEVCPTVRSQCTNRRCSRLLAKSASNLLKSIPLRFGLTWEVEGEVG